MNQLPDPENPKYRFEITEEFGTSNLEIDLGVGNRRHRPQFIGVDIRDYPAVDIICDCTKLIPLPDNSVTHCYSYHMLEHIDVNKRPLLYAEVARVCAPGATLEWWFPYWTHPTAYNSSHIAILNEHSFEEPPFVGRFVLERFHYHYTPEFEKASDEEKEFARKHYMNSVREMGVYFRSRKK